jgi:prepilin-type N-terminal cleavage/methylation domain-containing protein
MRQIVLQNRQSGQHGVSLVEVMISLVILLFVFMGLIQAALLSIDSNIRNEIRDEAVRIASEDMARRRASFGVDSVRNINRTFRNLMIAFRSNTFRSGNLIDVDSEQVTVTVTWTYKGENFTHSIISIVRNQ